MSKSKTLLDTVIDSLSKPCDRYSSYKDGYRFNGVDYDSESGNSCGGNCDDYMCHHGTITNTRINSVDIDALIKDLLGSSKEMIDAYCIDRIIRLSDIKETSSWRVLTHHGYYGEETCGVELSSTILNSVIDSLKEMNKGSDADKIKFCLKEEYGSVLEQLKPLSNVKSEDVKVQDIELFNDSYQRKLNKKYIDQYNNFDLPRAICVKAGKKYRVIDGYHRMTAAVNSNLKKAKILVLY